MRRILILLALAAVLLTGGCSFVRYSFSGTSIDPDVKTVTINYFEYKAMKVNPTLSNDITEALKDKFRKMTNLEQVEMDGDLDVSGEVTGYEVRASAVTADEVAAQNRLTVTCKLKFGNHLPRLKQGAKHTFLSSTRTYNVSPYAVY